MVPTVVQSAKTRPLLHRLLQTGKEYVQNLGPGLITGVSDDDPSCLGTFVQTGIQFGYLQLWMALLTYPLMGVIQEMCARIGLQTGNGLAENIRRHYPRPILYSNVGLIVVASTITLGADLGAMAASAQLILGIPFVVWLVAIPLVSIGVGVLSSYSRYVYLLRFLTLTLLVYVVGVFVVPQNWGQILRGTLVPTFQFNQDLLMNIVAIFGSTISPYLYFWQMSLEVEGKTSEGNIAEHEKEGLVSQVAAKGISPAGLRRMRVDVISGMFFSGLVAWSVMVTMASTLHRQGITNVDTAAKAAEALRPVAGDLSYFLFAIGIIGAGMLALPVLAGSVAYAVTGAFDLSRGFSHQFLNAPGFYGVIIVSTAIGAGMDLLGINPIQALYYAAIINGLAAPPLLAIILLIGGNREIMQDRANGPISRVIGWTVVLVMSLSALLLIWVVAREQGRLPF